jgi:hypothetical protein
MTKISLEEKKLNQCQGYFYIFTMIFLLLWFMSRDNLGSVCDASWHPKLLLYHVIRNVVVSSFCWYNACLQWFSSLSLMSCFFFFPSFLSPYSKIIAWRSWLLVFNFSPYSFDFSFLVLAFFLDVLFVFNVILESHFTKYYFLQFGPHSLNF